LPKALQWLDGTPTKTPVDIDVAQKKAYELLKVFENHLRDRTGWSAIAPRSRTLPALHCPCGWKIALDAYP